MNKVSKEKHKEGPLTAGIIWIIQNELPLEEVVREHIELKKSGDIFIGECPFGGCGTSLIVNPETSCFYCQGCQKNGDVLSFIMETEQVNLREAIKIILSRYAGL
ncbi:MAG TPA: CHC2 zinc finger domain-containing protein [Thermodesulfobacteriota bacterium]|nr:CHC2 zinc finger domain-containing protein [Thermodesulfobacteriota bacterium]